MDTIENVQVAEVFNGYPEEMRKRLLVLRKLIFETVAETEGVDKLEETLKWGQPGYLAKNGSTIRIDLLPASPDQYGMYFHCKTTLIETFKELYGDLFNYQGNRAIIFNAADEIPVQALKDCIELALTYHKIKHLPMLGG